jgi:hypothetical protein
MSVLSDGLDIDIEVRRRGGGYILIAYGLGVVVRSKDLKSGIEELERRVAAIGEDFRDVGLPLPSRTETLAKNEARPFNQIARPLITLVTVAAVLASLVFLVAAPIVAALAGVRTAISTLIPADEGSTIAGVGRRGIDFIVKVSQTLEQVTPQRKEELRTAIRKIAREVDSVIEDVKAAPPPPPQPPPNGDKR